MRINIRIKRCSGMLIIMSMSFILTFLFRAYADAFYNSKAIDGTLVNLLKYFALLVGIGLGGLNIILRIRNGRFISRYFTNGLTYTLLCVAFFAIISIVQILIVGKFTMMTVSGLFTIFLSAISAYVFLNNVDEETIYILMVMVLIGCFVFYIFEVGYYNLNSSTLFASSFSKSSSELESNYSSGTAVALCAFFSYKRKNKLISIFSLAFCILTFKRTFILTGLILFIVPLFIDCSKTCNKKLLYITEAFFVIATLVYLYIIGYSDLLTYNQAYQFTMGRNDFLYLLIDKEFVPYGYNSAMDFTRNIEMDLVRIYFEFGILGLTFFTHLYFKLAQYSIYSYLLMSLIFANLLFSHSLLNPFPWILYYIIFGLCENDKKNRENRIVIKTNGGII